jgi:hypothetical protein
MKVVIDLPGPFPTGHDGEYYLQQLKERVRRFAEELDREVAQAASGALAGETRALVYASGRSADGGWSQEWRYWQVWPKPEGRQG